MNKKAVLEGLLFLSGSDGISLLNLASILEVEEEELKVLIKELSSDYEKEERGIRLDVLGGNLKLTTKQCHKSYYEKLVEVEKSEQLSIASLEVLAIIAYNQPVTRITVDEIRGVSCSHLIRKLLNMNLIEDCGRANTPGRPMLYKTTKDFLDHFGLSKIEDLPELENLKDEEIMKQDLFESKYTESIE